MQLSHENILFGKKNTNDEIKHFISRKGVEIAHLVDHSKSAHNESNIESNIMSIQGVLMWIYYMIKIHTNDSKMRKCQCT